MKNKLEKCTRKEDDWEYWEYSYLTRESGREGSMQNYSSLAPRLSPQHFQMRQRSIPLRVRTPWP
jgi:hypothetical protein